MLPKADLLSHSPLDIISTSLPTKLGIRLVPDLACRFSLTAFQAVLGECVKSGMLIIKAETFKWRYSFMRLLLCHIFWLGMRLRGQERVSLSTHGGRGWCDNACITFHAWGAGVV